MTTAGTERIPKSFARWATSGSCISSTVTSPTRSKRRFHFHELMARGEESFVEVLRTLKTALPNWTLLAFEQPRLTRAEKAQISETRWLYSQSNILIHHLIGNGRILSKDAWKDLGYQAGCQSVTDRACNYLGYRAFLFQL